MKNSSSPTARAKKKRSKQRLIKPFPIVGIGASAGGIKAFTTLLEHLDPTLGMAYVLIMHLAPHHKSALAEIVQSKTSMPVHTVKDGMEVKANHIYVIPPNTYVSIVDGHLILAPRSEMTIGNFAVDYFLTGLASLYKNNAIGVILSGTATDGTLGLKAIKAEGGITFAQDKTAEFTGMPRHAYDSGFVDFMLPTEGIANELARLVETPYTILPSDKIEKEHDKIPGQADDLKKILTLVKTKWGVDFFLNYKQASIYRRVVRRIVLNKFQRIRDYYGMLRSNPGEVDALYHDFLINVTHFFRDPEFYKILAKDVFPSIVQSRQPNDAIRIWVAGCSTGEEAFSIAISLLDYFDKHEITIPIQVFASDLDTHAIEAARSGVYAASALQGVSPAQLQRYFKRIDGHYQIVKSVRELCVFSNHNLLKDPPFSRVDLISCQNVLIYLETAPQKRILQTFHYALRPSGFLFLGRSETIGTSTELFEPLDKKIRLFSRKPVSTHLNVTLPVAGALQRKSKILTTAQAEDSIDGNMGKLILSHYVYPCVIVNKGMKIVQFFGETAPYLAPVSGKASLNVLKMVREDLSVELMSLLQAARKTGKKISKEGIHIVNNKVRHEIAIEVVPQKTEADLFFLIVFKEKTILLAKTKGVEFNSKNRDHKARTIAKLENELVESRGLIRSTSEEYETTYEELQANSEEILSSNEELQSVNEELETSKEELQSSNEELTTTNEELIKRNTELSESQKELKKVNDQLEQFAFISSHDLQEPLRKIEIFSDFLSGPEANLNEYAKNYATKINSSAARMSKLLKDLLSFSVLNSGENKKLTNVDLNETLRNVLEDFEVTIDKKETHITHDELPVVPAHAVQMNQLFHNLIGNALKFDSENPVIHISSRKAAEEDFSKHHELNRKTDYVAISIKDNGIGFDQKYATKMFSLFQRLHDRKDVAGTGIGLSICKKIAENHGGAIFADGKVNEGATFTFFLPSHPPSP